ncbi:MAG: stage sporulation protein [Bacillales bacterium]|jgi:stage III sporulation protein AH|nr:stage sporulation protein [Bacillales bacterium]
MLKKQTMWLLTMLSLVIVLSVYYITTPELQDSKISMIETKKAIKDNKTASKNDDKAVTVNTNTNEEFTALRMELEDQRAELREDLQSVVASANVSAEEKNKALDDLNRIAQVSEKESVLETMLKAEKSISDAFVSAEGDKARITITAKEANRSLANKVVQMAKSELGARLVAVTIEPTK